jgi:hypothetical protein
MVAVRKDRGVDFPSPASQFPKNETVRPANRKAPLAEGTHSLAPRPGSLVRLTFQIGVPPRS